MTWRRVDPYFARRIQLAIFVIAFGFGVDYLSTPVGSSSALTAIERTWLPLWAWGAIIMAASAAGFFVEWRILDKHHPLTKTPERWRWGWITNIAHIVLFAMFVALTVSVMVELIARGIHGGGWYGWRTAVMYGGFAFGNWQFIRRLGEPA